jgi:hypothetical protein
VLGMKPPLRHSLKWLNLRIIRQADMVSRGPAPMPDKVRVGTPRLIGGLCFLSGQLQVVRQLTQQRVRHR